MSEDWDYGNSADTNFFAGLEELVDDFVEQEQRKRAPVRGVVGHLGTDAEEHPESDPGHDVGRVLHGLAGRDVDPADLGLAQELVDAPDAYGVTNSVQLRIDLRDVFVVADQLGDETTVRQGKQLGAGLGHLGPERVPGGRRRLLGHAALLRRR